MVATIVVILTVIVAVNLEKARVKSRDVQRKADLSQMSAALEMYKAEAKAYPVLDSFGSVTASIISTAYLPIIPVDPVNDSTYKYEYKGTVGEFKLRVKSEAIVGGDCTAAAVIAEAKRKAGDFYDPATGNCTYFQVSTSVAALNW